MPYRDMWVTCEECGEEFILTVEEQRRRGKSAEEDTTYVCSNCRGREERSLDPGQGEVKWYDPEKGYGFLVRHNGDEVFFHRTGVIEEDHRRLLEGARVTYELEETEKGLQAVNVALQEE